MLRLLAVAALVLSVVESISVWPHGLGYFNPLWGGPAVGHTLLHDSNLDWGQGLPELADWHRRHGRGRSLAVWYYGTDPAVLYPPFRPVNLSYVPVSEAGDGLLAVSVSAAYGNAAVTPHSAAAVGWLRDRQPVGRTTTFFVYDLRYNGPPCPPSTTP